MPSISANDLFEFVLINETLVVVRMVISMSYSKPTNITTSVCRKIEIRGICKNVEHIQSVVGCHYLGRAQSSLKKRYLKNKMKYQAEIVCAIVVDSLDNKSEKNLRRQGCLN